MKYRALGNTGIVVSEIGFGAWGIGGPTIGATSYGETDDEVSRDALRAAHEAGVTFFDTSDLYGYGHSEMLIGESLKGVRDKIVIASKGGFLEAGGPQDFSSRQLRKSLEESLRRLQTDYLDVYQLHSPPVELIQGNDELISTLENFVAEGKVRALGISVRSPDDGLMAAQSPLFSVIQVNFNLVDQRAVLNGLMDACRMAGIGIIVRTPLCFGFLTGKYSSETSFDGKDHRSSWSAAQKRRWAEAPGLFLAGFKELPGQTTAHMALRFCLSYEAVSTVIPGMLNRGHVEENASAGDFGVLSEQERFKLEAVYRENEFFVRNNK